MRRNPVGSGTLVVALVVGTLLVPVATPVGAATASDPYTVLDVERPGDGPVSIADPSVIRVGDTWYLYGTSSTDGFEAWSSTDLTTWTYEGLVWTPTPGSWNDEGNYWAPEVRVDGTDIWMYYTANERIGVARASSPTGPFVDQLDHPMVGAGYAGVGDGVYEPGDGLLVNNDEKSIDAFVLEDSQGRLWLYADIYTPLSAIAVWPMADETTPVGAPTPVLEQVDDSWEGFVREGAYVLEHEGTFHLLYSGQGADTPCYAVGVATAPSPTGPFTRRADNPILKQAPADDFWGPGHLGIVEGAQGDLLMFFHTKVAPDLGYDRRVRHTGVGFDPAGRVVLDPAPPGAGEPVADACVLSSGAPTPVPTTPSFTG